MVASYSQVYKPNWIEPLLEIWSRVLGSLYKPGGKPEGRKPNLIQTIEEERRLFGDINSGDKKSFETFYDLSSARVYGYFLKMVRSDDIATELLQETYIALWKQRKYLAEVAYPRAYTMRIASRALYRYFSEKNKTYELLELEESEQLIHPDTESQMSLETKEILQLIEIAVKRLPPQQQHVFRLNKYDGFSYKEIAEQLNLSVSTVSNYLELAMKKVRTSLLGEQF